MMRILVFKLNKNSYSVGVKGIPPELVSVFFLKAIDIVGSLEYETQDIDKKDVIIDIQISEIYSDDEPTSSLEDLIEINVVSCLSQSEIIHVLVTLLLSMETGTFFLMPF